MHVNIKQYVPMLCRVAMWSLVLIDRFPPIISTNFNYNLVTMGSTLKLVNKQFNVRLHSHEVKYGSGSGQQSVTGMAKKEDANSYWLVRSPTDAHVTRGTPIKCGQKIRITHLKTMANLHSHHFSAPLSTGLEVSCFGEDGEGDHLDNWIVECPGTHWTRDEWVKFRHAETKNYLTCSDQTFGRPISGQREIMATGPSFAGNWKQWKAMEGVYLKPSE